MFWRSYEVLLKGTLGYSSTAIFRDYIVGMLVGYMTLLVFCKVLDSRRTPMTNHGVPLSATLAWVMLGFLSGSPSQKPKSLNLAP